MKRILFIFLSLSITFAVIAQTDSIPVNELINLSLEELMNIPVSIASPKASTVSETPGIVTLITHDDIKTSGARDLLELLRFVPGFDFGAELDNVIGLGVRGNNATEGKFLLLIDGHQMNETNYGSFAFGNHILLDNIERIEIIRGPGSAIYGGLAELAVIKIITKKGREINGASASVDYSISEGKSLRNSYQFAIGKKLKNELEISLSGYYGMANRSNLTLQSSNGSMVNYADSSDIQSINLNLGVNYKNLKINFLHDDFTFRNLEKQIGSVLFNGEYLGIEYSFNLCDKIKITPKANWKQQKPWQFVDFDDYKIYNTTNMRHTASLLAQYLISDNVTLIGGTEYFIELGKKEEDNVVYNNGLNEIHYSDLAFIFEGVFTPKVANITLGSRLENHSEFGFAYVPRIAITKKFDNWHQKILYSRSFKAPTIQNIDINPDINPETSDIVEMETGYKISENMMLTVNFFDIILKNPIVYLWDDNVGDSYVNYDKIETNGVEIQYRIKGNWGLVNANYSLYRAAYNGVPDYNIEGHNEILGAFPNSKISLNASFKLTDKLCINPNYIFYSKRYTYLFNDLGELELKKLSPSNLVNLCISYENLIKGLTVSAGVYDIFNEKYSFINAYKAGIDPIPTPGREIYLKLRFELK